MPPKAARTASSDSQVPRKGDAAAAVADHPVTMAVVTGAHGIGGEVRLKIFADDLAAHRSFNGGALTLTALRDTIARFAEVTDRTAAEALRGQALTVPRAALPPLAADEYYHVDLIGLAVADEAGGRLGIVAGVENFGAGDILDVERPVGGRFMVPVAAATIGETVTVAADWAV